MFTIPPSSTLQPPGSADPPFTDPYALRTTPCPAPSTPQLKELRKSAWLNLAAVELKRNNYREAQKSATKVRATPHRTARTASPRASLVALPQRLLCLTWQPKASGQQPQLYKKPLHIFLRGLDTVAVVAFRFSMEKPGGECSPSC